MPLISPGKLFSWSSLRLEVSPTNYIPLLSGNLAFCYWYYISQTLLQLGVWLSSCQRNISRSNVYNFVSFPLQGVASSPLPLILPSLWWINGKGHLRFWHGSHMLRTKEMPAPLLNIGHSPLDPSERVRDKNELLFYLIHERLVSLSYSSSNWPLK